MSDRSPSPSANHAHDDEPFDGHPSWRVTRELKDGTIVTIRPLGPDDRDELRRAFQATSPETRYLRFLRSMTELSDDALAYLTNVDQKKHVAIVATVTSPDLKAERGVGVARFVGVDDAPGVVEAAITVVDDMQRKGLGTILVRELEKAARARNVRRIRAQVLADNTTMRSLLESVGAEPVTASSGELRAGPDTPPEIDEGTVSYDIELKSEHAQAWLASVLRGAAQTMALTLRRLLPPAAPRSEPSAAAANHREREGGTERRHERAARRPRGRSGG